MNTDIIILMLGFIGICAYFSYKSGFNEGYRKLAQEVAETIIDIHFEKEKVQLMKLEAQKLQEECAKILKENKEVTQS